MGAVVALRGVKRVAVRTPVLARISLVGSKRALAGAAFRGSSCAGLLVTDTRIGCAESPTAAIAITGTAGGAP
eukprot:16433738-Heterocapsa_arctica.AAC.1